MRPKEPRYENGDEFWECSACKRWLHGSEYYKDNRTANGLKAQCKRCHTSGSLKTRSKENSRKINREYARRARDIDPNRFRVRERIYSKKRPKNEKIKAREKLNAALRAAKIIKPTNCSACGKIRKLTAHHDDYSKPLEVRWLCYRCHGEEHCR